ncbi:MAG TPA: glycine--tRNA ligase subunit beta, partial [Candidatus Fraserbacteria bacterium]|nr:glycine--tRNA ligase subunit beta [Candidatus Fraserbacteria bacterium]
MRDLVLEIGVEEIPPGQLPELARQLSSAAQAELKAERLAYQALRVDYTLRRLVLFVAGLQQQQSDSRREIKGPPKRAAFDA